MSPVKDRLTELQQKTGNGSTETDKKKTNKDVGKYLDKCQKVRELIHKFNENTAKAQLVLQNEKLRVSKDMQNELKALFKDSETIALKVSKEIKELKVDKNELESDANAENKMKYLQYSSLHQYFRETLNKHSECIEERKKHLKIVALKTYRIINGSDLLEEEELEDLIEADQTQAFTDDYLANYKEVQQQLRNIEERHQELLLIENHLREIKDLFVQIAILVEEQQESIDRIEHHALLSVDAVESAHTDILSARKKKKKIGKVKIYIMIGVCVLVVIIILSFIIH